MKGYQIDNAVACVSYELARATAAHGSFASPHEGWAVIKEEMDELWEHVRGNTGRSQDAIDEAIQIAAMAIRYMIDMGV